MYSHLTIHPRDEELNSRIVSCFKLFGFKDYKRLDSGLYTALLFNKKVFKRLEGKEESCQYIGFVLKNIDSIDTSNPSHLDHSNLGGHYVLLIEETDGFCVYCDPLITYPVYRNKKGVISTSLPVLQELDGPHEINRQGLLENLLLGYIIRPDTLLVGIEQLYHGNSTNWSRDGLVFKADSPAITNKFKYNSRYDAVKKELKHLNSIYASLKSQLGGTEVDFGLSGGLDSRLNLSLLIKNNINFAAHTLYKGDRDGDYKVANNIAKNLSLKLRSIPTENEAELSSKKLLERFNRVETFFGASYSVNSFLNEAYTESFRYKVIGNRKLTLAGFGGEIYRNYNFFPPFSISENTWINHFIINNSVSLSLDLSNHSIQDCLRRIKSKIRVRMNILDISTNTIDQFKHLSYYSNVWLPDCIGLKIAAENQLNDYYAPFVDHLTIANLSKFSSFIGTSFEFEALMIANLNAGVAAINTVYGYPIKPIPYITRKKHWFKSHFPSKLKRIIQKNCILKTDMRVEQLLSKHQFLQEYATLLEALQPGINIPAYFRSSDNFDTAMSTAHSFSKHCK